MTEREFLSTITDEDSLVDFVENQPALQEMLKIYTKDEYADRVSTRIQGIIRYEPEVIWDGLNIISSTLPELNDGWYYEEMTDTLNLDYVAYDGFTKLRDRVLEICKANYIFDEEEEIKDSNNESQTNEYIPVLRQIARENIEETIKVLIDNGIEEDEAETVLQAIGYTLLCIELFPDN